MPLNFDVKTQKHDVVWFEINDTQRNNNDRLHTWLV